MFWQQLLKDKHDRGEIISETQVRADVARAGVRNKKCQKVQSEELGNPLTHGVRKEVGVTWSL